MAAETRAGGSAYFSGPAAVRLFLTCWMIYCLHFWPFIVRELYLTMSLVEKQSAQVEEYAGLHSDLFEIPGRGWYVSANPGTSLLAAVPYGLAYPVVQRVAPVRPAQPGEKVSAEYNEERANKLAFYRKVRERGLDLRLGVAAMITVVFLMAPLTALSAVVMFRLLGRLGYSQAAGLWLALLYALGTPVFFRTATLSLNLLVCLLGFFAFALLWWPQGTLPGRQRLRLVAAGFLAGYAVMTDYSGVVTASVLGLFAFARELETKRLGTALRDSLWFLAGAVWPLAFLLYWQWVCYGNPWLPVQVYMPKQVFAGYASQYGFGWPQPKALWSLLFDPLYGLLVFSPLLAIVLYHPALLRRGTSRLPRRIAVWAWVFSVAVWVFCASVHYTLRHQWQDGVRYMVPAVPFLFLLVADVLARMPRWLALLTGGVATVETVCLSMVRESPLESLTRVFTHGVEFPWLTALARTAPQYYPPLAENSAPVAWGAFALAGIMVLLIWVAGPKQRST